MLDRTMAANAVSGADGSILPIEGKGLSFARKGRLLLDIDQVVFGEPGVTAILGHNGAGKSLLIKILAGLQSPDQGSVSWAGRPPDRAGYRRLGYMKQTPVLLRRTARANLEFPLRLVGVAKVEARERADRALAEASLTAIADASARVLSGGERQRLSLARTLMQDPELLFLDEPVTGLDPASAVAIDRTIQKLKAGRKSIVLVTHNLAQARRLADRIMLIHQGRLEVAAPAAHFFKAPASPVARRFLEDADYG